MDQDAIVNQKKLGKVIRPKYLPTMLTVCSVLSLSTMAFIYRPWDQKSEAQIESGKNKLLAIAPDTDEVYLHPEKKPVFPGGDYAFFQFLARILRYPTEDKDNRIEGKVYTKFIIEKDGTLDDIIIISAPSATLGAEAKHILQKCPKWIPGMQDGQPVRVQYFMPVNFSLH